MHSTTVVLAERPIKRKKYDTIFEEPIVFFVRSPFDKSHCIITLNMRCQGTLVSKKLFGPSRA
jgi:hypothetical protein